MGRTDSYVGCKFVVIQESEEKRLSSTTGQFTRNHLKVKQNSFSLSLSAIALEFRSGPGALTNRNTNHYVHRAEIQKVLRNANAASKKT